MPKFGIEVYDVSVRTWCYFGLVDAADEEQAISEGWERVEKLDIDSKSTIQDLRVKRATRDSPK